MKRVTVGVLLLAAVGLFPIVRAQPKANELFRLESSILLPDVHGRIDHMSIDLAGNQLFVAALENDTVEVIDLKGNRHSHTISGLAEPQVIAFVPAINRLFVANGHDGSVRLFDDSSWKLLKSVSYGDDADNLRYDSETGHLWVGYGGGALGEFDQEGTKLVDIKVGAHPESFQLEKNGSRIFINLPTSRKIGVVDRGTRVVAGSWGTGGPLANFPMALDEKNHRLFVVTRLPARLIVFGHAGRKKDRVTAGGRRLRRPLLR
jgi:YVTN family beta-propeller protein